jgi:hypothetical protein
MCLYVPHVCADKHVDDIKDIYRRAEGQELVVEGLREGSNFNVEE